VPVLRYVPRRAANAIKTADLLLVIALFLIMIGGYHVHFMLTAGDWDFWIDWKDRRFWPTVLPIMLVTFVAAAQYFFWEHFRLPFGATFVSLALLTGEWIDRYVSFWAGPSSQSACAGDLDHSHGAVH